MCCYAGLDLLCMAHSLVTRAAQTVIACCRLCRLKHTDRMCLIKYDSATCPIQGPHHGHSDEYRGSDLMGKQHAVALAMAHLTAGLQAAEAEPSGGSADVELPATLEAALGR